MILSIAEIKDSYLAGHFKHARPIFFSTFNYIRSQKEEMMSKVIDQHCPGDDPVKKHHPEYFICPKCGAEVEMWSDKESSKCSKCQKLIHRKDLKESS
jgi:hypothetical protein